MYRNNTEKILIVRQGGKLSSANHHTYCNMQTTHITDSSTDNRHSGLCKKTYIFKKWKRQIELRGGVKWAIRLYRLDVFEMYWQIVHDLLSLYESIMMADNHKLLKPQVKQQLPSLKIRLPHGDLYRYCYRAFRIWPSVLHVLPLVVGVSSWPSGFSGIFPCWNWPTHPITPCNTSSRYGDLCCPSSHDYKQRFGF